MLLPNRTDELCAYLNIHMRQETMRRKDEDVLHAVALALIGTIDWRSPIKVHGCNDPDQARSMGATDPVMILVDGNLICWNADDCRWRPGDFKGDTIPEIARELDYWGFEIEHIVEWAYPRQLWEDRKDGLVHLDEQYDTMIAARDKAAAR